MPHTMTRRDALWAWFGVDDDWERPVPPIQRSDVLVGLVSFLLVLLSLELLRSYADFTGARSFPIELLAIATGTLPLIWRRRFPLAVGLWMGLHFWVTGTWVGEVGYQFVYQVAVFYALYCMLAWGRDRRLMLAGVGGLLLGLVVWLAWLTAVGSGADMLRARSSDGRSGLFPPLVAAVAFTFVTNLVLFVAAALTGQVAWRQARGRALIEQQAARLSEQSSQLAEQAVVEERLRLARELHDVVAHHVSVMGVQAAAARRVLDRQPDMAREALTNVEASSREAVSQMRGLLGALRSSKPDEGRGRDPEPTLAELPALVEGANVAGFRATLSVVDSEGTGGATVPPPVQLSIYRVVQEALTNVRRHSTATSASVTLRLHEVARPSGYAEVEVLDEGRPRAGTSGTGMGQLGMRERIASLKGSAEIGPRATGGYRVRVRFPTRELT